MRVCATNVWPIKDYIMELVLKLAECKEASVIWIQDLLKQQTHLMNRGIVDAMNHFLHRQRDSCWCYWTHVLQRTLSVFWALCIFRVLALQKSGETDWKRRLEDSRDSSSPEDSAVVLRDKKDSGEGSERPRLRPTSIADRLSLLHSSKETWRDKVEEKDIKLFTVEGKMSRLGIRLHIVSQFLLLLEMRNTAWHLLIGHV